jgi:hypothetical protein
MVPLSLSTRRTKALALLIPAAAATVVFAGPAPHVHAWGCAPVASVPSINTSRQGTAKAYLPCGGTYSISLVNNAGTTLGSPHSDNSPAGNVSVGPIACAGAIVHTFVWVNVAGTVTSDTSGTTPC